MICPSCEADINDPGPTCPACSTSLASLIRLKETADLYFNRAVSACENSDWLTAVEHLSAVRALDPTDIQAVVLLGKVYIAMDRLDRAATLLVHAFKMDARNPEVKSAIKWIGASGIPFPMGDLLG